MSCHSSPKELYTRDIFPIKIIPRRERIKHIKHQPCVMTGRHPGLSFFDSILVWKMVHFMLSVDLFLSSMNTSPTQSWSDYLLDTAKKELLIDLGKANANISVGIGATPKTQNVNRKYANPQICVFGIQNLCIYVGLNENTFQRCNWFVSYTHFSTHKIVEKHTRYTNL